MALELTMDDCHLSDITKIGIKKIYNKKIIKKKKPLELSMDDRHLSSITNCQKEKKKKKGFHG
jgi:hypothetical protein